jgi:hypothetical protein
MAGDGPFSDAAIEAAVQAMSEPGRLDEAQRVVATAAPQLQRILDEALEAAEWYGSAHQAAVLEASPTWTSAWEPCSASSSRRQGSAC